MPSAGSKTKALDFPPIAWLDEPSDTSFTNTAYSATAGAPTLPVCGVTFTAPTSGRIKVTFNARFECKTNSSRAVVSIEVATGGAPGSGTVISGGDDDNAIETTQSSTAATTPAETRAQMSNYRIVSGLTTGSTYNAYTVHKCFSATGGNMYDRGILVEPMP